MSIRLTINGHSYSHRTVKPRDSNEIMKWIEQGRVAPAEALAHFHQLERDEMGDAAQLEQRRRLESALAELNSLIGLKTVKDLIHELRAYVEIQQYRRQVGLLAESVVLHMIFKGNPGTGKTTVARILAKLLKELGVLAKGHVVEVERADLVGEYIGHTAQKTRAQIQKALGGVLFIDEAYSLARGGDKDFGKEAIDTLVRAMEEHRNDLVLILAGYRAEMEWFLLQNPGLRSRFPLHLEFADYTVGELLQIAELMVSQRQYRLDDSARQYLEQVLTERYNSMGMSLGNARTVRNIIEHAIRRQAVRLVSSSRLPSRNDLMLITRADLEDAVTA